jgi:hypothetical protein
MVQIFSRLRCETTGDSRNLSAINNLANEVLTTYARSQDRTEVSGHLPYAPNERNIHIMRTNSWSTIISELVIYTIKLSVLIIMRLNGCRVLKERSYGYSKGIT